MKNKLLSLLALFFIGGNCFGQVMFQKVITAFSGSGANSVQQTTNGGYIIAGGVAPLNSNYNDVFLVRTNGEGDTLWTKTYGGANVEGANSVQQTKDGGFIVVGNTSSFGPSEDIYVIKTDANGDTLWTKTFGGNNNDIGYSVQQTNDGGYIIAGSTNSFGAGDDDVYLIKIDSTGDLKWTKTFGGSSNDEGQCVKQTSDSGYIICGTTYNFGSGNGLVYLIKTNPNGDTLWTKTYGDTTGVIGNAVQQTFDGGFIVAGLISGFGLGDADVYLIKTNSLGDTLWTKAFYQSIDNSGYDVKQTKDSGYVVTGITTNNRYFESDIYLIKTNYKGDTLWTRQFGGTNLNYGNSVSQAMDGGYIIAGTTYSFVSLQEASGVYLIKTDVNGNSGCYESSTNTIVSSTNTIVGNTNTIVGSGGIASPTNTLIGSGGNDSTLCLSVGIQELVNENNIILYPNPATNEIRINSTHAGADLRMTKPLIYIINALGQTVYQSAIGNWQSAINISSLSKGLYFVRIADEKQSWSGKFVKE